MNLLAASKIQTNTEVRARVEAAIRKAASERTDDEGASGLLAEAALTAPETVSAGFLQRVATNPGVTTDACPSCGHSGADDDALEWIVNKTWDEVANKQFGAVGGRE